MKLVREIVDLFSQIATTVSGLQHASQSERPFPTERNRKKVRTHLSAERSAALANRVKIRDGFRCRVCDLNFEERYGTIGKGFAEAHHTIPVSTKTSGTLNTNKDVITVCANCHRMLHRMEFKRDAWRDLRRIVKAHRRAFVD